MIFLAVLFQSVLIGRTSKAGANVPLFNKESKKNFFPKFPYSILLAEVGLLFAIIGWVLCIAMYCKLRKQFSGSKPEWSRRNMPCSVARSDYVRYRICIHNRITGSGYKRRLENINQCFTRSWCDINFKFTWTDPTRCSKYCIWNIYFQPTIVTLYYPGFYFRVLYAHCFHIGNKTILSFKKQFTYLIYLLSFCILLEVNWAFLPYDFVT